jgi:hypothetical protein
MPQLKNLSCMLTFMQEIPDIQMARKLMRPGLQGKPEKQQICFSGFFIICS